MIKYFTYYSCGGYKDIYIGSDKDSAPSSYLIPLLNIWKKSNKPENAEKIARAESVQHVELITKSNSAGFPSECNLMFSHGGYCAIYRTLTDGRVCLCIRDISNGATDEEGRETPFNFLFLADDQESILKLDRLAVEYLSNDNEINESIAHAISYDYKVNGVKFDLSELNSLLPPKSESSSALYHEAGTIDYLKIASRLQLPVALKEQNLVPKTVKSVWGSAGTIYGGLQFFKDYSQQSIHDKTKRSITGSSQKVRPSTAETVKPEDHKDNPGGIYDGSDEM